MRQYACLRLRKDVCTVTISQVFVSVLASTKYFPFRSSIVAKPPAKAGWGHLVCKSYGGHTTSISI